MAIRFMIQDGGKRQLIVLQGVMVVVVGRVAVLVAAVAVAVAVAIAAVAGGVGVGVGVGGDFKAFGMRLRLSVYLCVGVKA